VSKKTGEKWGKIPRSENMKNTNLFISRPLPVSESMKTSAFNTTNTASAELARKHRIELKKSKRK